SFKKINYSYYIARRFLQYRRKRAGTEIQVKKAERRFISFIVGIAIGGVALGTATLIVTLAILSGFEKTLTSNIVGYTAHADITSYGNRPLPDYQSSMQYLFRKVPEIKALSPYVEQQVVLRTSRGLSGIILQGVLPNDSLTLALKRIISGTTLVTNADSLPQ